MNKNILFIGIILIAAGSLTGCSSQNKSDEQDVIEAKRDSIAKAKELEEARLDSINFEETRLKPSIFIERVSSNCYAFKEISEITSNLRSLDFKINKSKRIDVNNPYDFQCFISIEKIKCKSEIPVVSTEIDITEFDIDWGGYCTAEPYITINFNDERSKEAFLKDIRNMNFVYPDENKEQIVIGNISQNNGNFYKDAQEIILNYSKPLQINLYTEEAMKLNRKY